MDDYKTQKLYKSFPLIYRERLMTLAQSNMPRGFQCGNGWYEIISGVSANLELMAQRALNDDERIAVSEVRADGDKLIFEISNNTLVLGLSPDIEKFISDAQQRCKYTCEWCGYSPAFLQDGETLKNTVCCDRCVNSARHSFKRRRRSARPQRGPTIEVLSKKKRPPKEELQKNDNLF